MLVINELLKAKTSDCAAIDQGDIFLFFSWMMFGCDAFEEDWKARGSLFLREDFLFYILIILAL